MGRDTLLGAHGWIILVFGLIVSLGIVEVMNGGRRRETSHDHARPKTEPAESIPLDQRVMHNPTWAIAQRRLCGALLRSSLVGDTGNR